MATARTTDWAETAQATLAARGHRAGGARTAVIELLGAEGGCCNAEDVARDLRAQGRRVGTASVYRALAVLADAGLVQKVAVPGSPTRFELVHAGGEHHHHAVCERCGKTVPFSDEELEAAVQAVSDRVPFRIDSHDVTLHGTCEACARA